MTKATGIGRGGRRTGGRPPAEEKVVPLKLYIYLSELREAYQILEPGDDVTDVELLAWARTAAQTGINQLKLAAQERLKSPG
jgi:hypothetical protein